MQTMSERVIAVFGGTGFVGRDIVLRLLRAGARVHVYVRAPNLGLDLKLQAQPGQLELHRFNIAQASHPDLEAALARADSVVNAVGILAPTRKQSFVNLHADAPKRLAQAAQAKGITKFVHISALGSDKHAPAHYARSKYLGEQAVHGILPQACVLRPSLILGRRDDFFGRFGQLARWSPALPLMGGGHTRFQPVAVEDVADIVVEKLDRQAPAKPMWEIGGPETISFKGLMERMLTLLHWRRLLLPVPFPLAHMLSWMTQYFPGGLQFTPDQLRLLRSDNVIAQASADTTKITPTPLADMLQASLERFQSK